MLWLRVRLIPNLGGSVGAVSDELELLAISVMYV